MGNPAYSLNGISYTTLPGKYRFGGRPRSTEESNINLESDSGVEFVYRLFKKKRFELIWTLTDAEFTDFETFDAAIDGEITPFYFSLNGTGSDAVLVRKESGLDPQERDQPKRLTATSWTPMFDYTLRLKQALT